MTYELPPYFYAFVGVFMYFLCGFAENKRGDKMDKIKNVWERSRRSANTLAVLKSLAVTLACLFASCAWVYGDRLAYRAF